MGVTHSLSPDLFSAGTSGPLIGASQAITREERFRRLKRTVTAWTVLVCAASTVVIAVTLRVLNQLLTGRGHIEFRFLLPAIDWWLFAAFVSLCIRWELT